MTVVTKEYIDIIAPKHSRTRCSDATPFNGERYEGELVRTHDDEIIETLSPPRCNRCFLLNNMGNDIDNLGYTVILFFNEIGKKWVKA